PRRRYRAGRIDRGPLPLPPSSRPEPRSENHRREVEPGEGSEKGPESPSSGRGGSGDGHPPRGADPPGPAGPAAAARRSISHLKRADQSVPPGFAGSLWHEFL